MYKYRFLLPLTFIIASTFLTGCGPKTINVKEIKLSEERVNVYDDGTKSISATVLPENASNKELEWTSSDDNIAYYADGKIYGKNLGQATLTATSVQNPGVSSSCTVTVRSMSSYTITFYTEVGGAYAEQQVRAGEKAIKPADPKVSRKTFVGWYDYDNNPFNFDNPVTSDMDLQAKFNDIEVQSISLEPNQLEMAKDSYVQLDVTYNPVDSFYKTITWSVEQGQDVVSVNKGLVTGLKEGTAKVKATTANGKFAYCDVTVADFTKATAITVTSKDGKTTINGGESLELSASIAPSDANVKRVKWSLVDSQNTGATIQKTGPLTATLNTTNVGGTVKVVASAIDGSGVTGEFDVTIKSTGFKINWSTDVLTSKNETLYDYAKRSDTIIFGTKEKYQSEFTTGYQELNVAYYSDDRSKIKAYFGGKNPYENKLYIVSDYSIIFWDKDRPKNNNSTLGFFQNCSKVKKIVFENVSFASIKDMSSMFEGDTLLEDFNWNSFDISSCETMANMFKGCRNLVSLNLSSFDTAKVNDMTSMFQNCSKLETLYASDKFITNNLAQDKDISMFANCNKLRGRLGTSYDQNKTNKEYARLDTSDSKGYFTNFARVKIDWTTKIIKDNKNFYQVLCDINPKAIIFDKKYKYSSFPEGTSTYNIQEGTESLTIEAHITSDNNVYIISDDLICFEDNDKPGETGLFEGFTNLVNVEFLNIDTSLLTNMSAMFKSCSNLTNANLSRFNTMNVTNMSCMFNGCSAIKTIDIDSFNTPKLEDTSNMFDGCTNIHTIFASNNFIVDNVANSKGMFKNIPKDRGMDGLLGGDGSWIDGSKTNKEYARIDYREQNGINRKGYFTNKYRITLLKFGKSNTNYRPVIFEPNKSYHIYFYKNFVVTAMRFSILLKFFGKSMGEFNTGNYINGDSLSVIYNNERKVGTYHREEYCIRITDAYELFEQDRYRLDFYFYTTNSCPIGTCDLSYQIETQG